MSWWNNSYFIRRNLKILPSTGVPLLAGYPVYIAYDYASLLDANKVRGDFGDIEVLYHDSVADTWTVLGKQVFIQDLNLIVKFNLLFDVSQEDDSYYIYTTNSRLDNQPVDPDYIVSDYAIDTAVNGLGLSFTRPTDDWNEGLSLNAGARAAFVFNGVNAQLTMEMGSDRGQFLLQVDNQLPMMVDTYDTTRHNQVVYTTSGLGLGSHYIRINATGDKNPSATDFKVNLIGFQYSEFTQVTDLGEEINPSLTSIKIVVGP